MGLGFNLYFFGSQQKYQHSFTFTYISILSLFSSQEELCKEENQALKNRNDELVLQVDKTFGNFFLSFVWEFARKRTKNKDTKIKLFSLREHVKNNMLYYVDGESVPTWKWL